MFSSPSHWVFICMGVISLSFLLSRQNTLASPHVVKVLSLGRICSSVPVSAGLGSPALGTALLRLSAGLSRGESSALADLLVVLLMPP